MVGLPSLVDPHPLLFGVIHVHSESHLHVSFHDGFQGSDNEGIHPLFEDVGHKSVRRAHDEVIRCGLQAKRIFEPCPKVGPGNVYPKLPKRLLPNLLRLRVGPALGRVRVRDLRLFGLHGGSQGRLRSSPISIQMSIWTLAAPTWPQGSVIQSADWM